MNIATQKDFWSSFSQLHKNLYGETLEKVNEVKVFKILDPFNNTAITLTDASNFFLVYWCNPRNNYILRKKDYEFDERLFNGNEQITIRLKEIHFEDEDNKELL